MIWQAVAYIGFAMGGASVVIGGKVPSNTQCWMAIAAVVMIGLGVGLSAHVKTY